VIINCAMGVKQSFYRPFAQFLAASGYSVTTWDYRGVGESTLDARTARQITLDQWAEEDLSLVIEATVSANRDLPILVIGHSFGGQIIALPENRGEISAALLIACPSGYVGHWRGKRRGAFMWALAYIGLPVLTRLFGRFPASGLGLGADLPRMVALQWGSWLRHRRYIGGNTGRSERIASFAAPIHAVSFTDDELAPPEAVEAMLSLYAVSHVTSESFNPRDHDRERIGHMGFFRPCASNGLWKVAADRLDVILRLKSSGAGQPAA
jgi:predicted alpha/beta hydrolase